MLNRWLMEHCDQSKGELNISLKKTIANGYGDWTCELGRNIFYPDECSITLWKNKKLRTDIDNIDQFMSDPNTFLHAHPEIKTLNLTRTLGCWRNRYLNYLITNRTLDTVIMETTALQDEDVSILAKNNTFKTLILRNNIIRADGAKALALNQTLTTLDLRDNWIGEEGAKALAQNTTLTSILVSPQDVGWDYVKLLEETAQRNRDRNPPNQLSISTTQNMNAFFPGNPRAIAQPCMDAPNQAIPSFR